MGGKWVSYLRHVAPKLHIDRGFFKGAWVVANLYGHFKLGRGRQSLDETIARPTLAFFPQPAGPWYNIWLVLQNTSLKIVKDIHAADFIFIFDDSTSSKEVANLPTPITATLINHRVTDISKTHVGQIFENIFGYALAVNPLSYQGRVVEKSDENGTHDGRVVICPILETDIKPGYCYQKLIDSTFNGATSEDLRIACVYGDVAAVFHKHKALEKRFGTQYLSTDVRNAEDVFSSAELTLIAKFCREIGLDFGAIDVMRDKSDGRIYIVDVNKTCMPVLSLPKAEQYRSLSMIAEKLEENLLSKPRQMNDQ